MDKKLLKMASEAMRSLGLTEIKIKDGDIEIEMKREAAPTAVPSFEAHSDNEETAEIDDQEELVEIKSPLIGVFYRSPSPSVAPYVSEGSRVHKGDILCIIESMKMMTEIICEYDGTVCSIYPQNGMIVEYGQSLFSIIKD